MRAPLNGTRTHPLTDHAVEVMGTLKTRAVPAQEINPGVLNRLLREQLIDLIDKPSPYKTHRGQPISHARLSDMGFERLELELEVRRERG